MASVTAKSTAAADHAWFGTETVKTRLGNFEFKNSYPAGDSAKRLRDALAFNRVVYGPLEPFFDQTWKPDDIAKVK